MPPQHGLVVFDGAPALVGLRMTGGPFFDDIGEGRGVFALLNPAGRVGASGNGCYGL
jgi:hypothetical protein